MCKAAQSCKMLCLPDASSASWSLIYVRVKSIIKVLFENFRAFIFYYVIPSTQKIFCLFGKMVFFDGTVFKFSVIWSNIRSQCFLFVRSSGFGLRTCSTWRFQRNPVGETLKVNFSGWDSQSSYLFIQFLMVSKKSNWAVFLFVYFRLDTIHLYSGSFIPNSLAQFIISNKS